MKYSLKKTREFQPYARTVTNEDGHEFIAMTPISFEEWTKLWRAALDEIERLDTRDVSATEFLADDARIESKLRDQLSAECSRAAAAEARVRELGSQLVDQERLNAMREKAEARVKELEIEAESQTITINLGDRWCLDIISSKTIYELMAEAKGGE